MDMDAVSLDSRNGCTTTTTIKHSSGVHDTKFMCCYQVDAEDMRGTVATFLRLPVHEVKHPEFGTVMRMLDSEEPFSIILASDAAEA